MHDRIRDLAVRLRDAWPSVRVVLGDGAMLRRWLLGARKAQIALALTLVLGLFVVPPVRDAVVDAVFPAQQSRGGFLGLSRRRTVHPVAGPARFLTTTLFWLGGLGTTAALLALHANEVVGRRRRGEGSAAGQPSAVELEREGSAAGQPSAVELEREGSAAGQPSAVELERTMAAPAGLAATHAAPGATPAPAAGAPAPTGTPAVPGGRYRVERELGRGGVGVVYEAFDTVLERPVALKELPPTLVRHPDVAERFRTEARVLARLAHPGMVQVFDLVESDSGMWIAMELVPGGSLDAVIEQRGALPLAEAARLGAQMAEALAHAHAQGVVHRDFKPHNVLLAPDGTPKITDFGLAKIAREGPQLTQVGTIMGSPAYMSPEQASGRGADHRADAYALGVTLFQMVVGRCPFEGDTTSVLAAHITQPPPEPAELGAQVPPELAALLRQLLAKDPGERPENLADVAERLRRLA